MKPSRLVGVALVAPYLALQILGRTFGATRSERQAAMPGDRIVAHPTIQTTHASTIQAPPERVWPWLIQVGWHQGGWYTSPWVDRILFPDNWPAVDHIIPELQDRRVGDFIPDGAPETECGFVIEHLEPGRSLVLHSTTHLPLSWRRRLGARLDWTWDFQLEERDAGSRFVFRARGVTAPWWVTALYQVVIVPADFIMATQMMRGLKRRTERQGSRSDAA